MYYTMYSRIKAFLYTTSGSCTSYQLYQFYFAVKWILACFNGIFIFVSVAMAQINKTTLRQKYFKQIVTLSILHQGTLEQRK